MSWTLSSVVLIAQLMCAIPESAERPAGAHEGVVEGYHMTEEMMANLQKRCRWEQGRWLDFISDRDGERLVGCIWTVSKKDG